MAKRRQTKTANDMRESNAPGPEGLAPEVWFANMSQSIVKVMEVLKDISENDPNAQRRMKSSQTYLQISALIVNLSVATSSQDMAGAVAASMALGVIGGNADITDTERWAEIARTNAEKLATPNRAQGELNRSLVHDAYERILLENPRIEHKKLINQIRDETGLGRSAVYKHLPSGNI